LFSLRRIRGALARLAAPRITGLSPRHWFRRRDYFRIFPF
jgi:hypothetical protein